MVLCFVLMKMLLDANVCIADNPDFQFPIVAFISKQNVRQYQVCSV